MAKIHIHTKYSLLDAIIKPDELVQKLKAQGDTALCVTEHGNLYSDVEIYKLCQEYGIKYLLGCEMYICHDVNVKSKDSKYYHLVVIAKNETGRLNLNNLVSKSAYHKYYGKPRIDFKMLLEHREGLIILSACMAGEVQRELMSGNVDGAKLIARKYQEVFGDDYYLEYQSHSEETQQALNRKIVDLAKELNIKYVVTTDAHYLNKEDQKFHNVFVQIGQAREVGETYNDCYVQSDDEILSICKSTTREENLLALKNTEEIAQKCSVELPLSAPIMPHNPIPKEFKSEIDYLKHLCIKGWFDKKINLKPNITEYKERLGYEISVIKKMGFEGYYLLVDSYANSVKRRGIARGSGGGSLVAYLANIVDIDPVEYGLYFERFIDVGALDLLEQGKITKGQLKIPDFDLDFGKEDRNKVLEGIIQQYGQERVASLGSFQYIWAKGAIKDIGKVLDIPFEIRNEMTSKLDNETIEEVIELGLLDNYKHKYPELFVYAEKLAGLPKSFSAHPCGKIISMQNITYYNATDVNDNGEVILQGDMHTADDLGLIKIDLLGLRTVDVIYDVLDMINKDYQYIAPHNLDFNDKQVLENFRNGYTAGIFQFESNGMKETLKKIECNSLYDLTVANALYRPGSLKYIDNYAKRRKGEEEYQFLHDDLIPILKDSYAIIVFQEQLIEIGRLANLSNPDELRQATAKKKAKLLEKIKPELFNGLKQRGWTEAQVNALWESMLDFAKYSFNKSHAAAYAMIAYICMYLKTYHPREFMCAWINSVSDNIKKVIECVEEVNRLQLKVYKPSYNDCVPITSLYKDGIMFGINSVKYCNGDIAKQLMHITTGKKYDNLIELLDDIADNTTIQTNQLIALATLDYFREFGKNKYIINVINLYFGIKEKSRVVLPSFRTCKQISKDKIDTYTEYGVSEYIISKYATSETEKQFRNFDNLAMLIEMCNALENKGYGLIEQVKLESQYLGYINYKNPSVQPYYYIVVDFKTFKDALKPYVTLRRICDGAEIKTKIKKQSIFKNDPFGLYNVLRIDGFTKEYKKTNIDGHWVTTDSMEEILESYVVIK